MIKSAECISTLASAVPLFFEDDIRMLPGRSRRAGMKAQCIIGKRLLRAQVGKLRQFEHSLRFSITGKLDAGLAVNARYG